MPPIVRGISLYHPQGYLGRPNNPFGKDIANAALFRALLNHGGFTHASVHNQLSLSEDQLSAALDLPGSVQLSSAAINDTIYPARFGTLLRGQPYLSELSWLRRNSGLDRAYSLAGLVHTMAPPAVRELICSSALAPIHPWDALVCTSPAVQQGMHNMFDALAEHLASRLGASRAPRPQLPLIPLAVATDQLAQQGSDTNARAAFRQRLRVADDDVLVALGWSPLLLREGISPEHVSSHGHGSAAEPTLDAFTPGWLVPGR